MGGGGVGQEPELPRLKRTCKFCNKSFPSGKSLGGHMRSHVMGYGLRENPKKTRRLSEDEEEIEMELQDVALVLMMLSRDSAAAAEESSGKNSSVVEEEEGEEEFEEEWDMLKRRKSYLGSARSEDAYSNDGSWEKAELGSSRNGRRRRRSDDYGKFEKTPPSSSSKKSRFQCNTCKKVFGSYQALGGHRAAHKRTKGACFVPEDVAEAETVTPADDGDDDAEDDDGEEVGVQITSCDPPPKRKACRYQCPTCLKVFASGQALGGHKRSHVAVNSSVGVDGRRLEEMDGLLDLNAPAPAPAPADENSSITNAHIGSMAWSVRKNSSTTR